MGRTKTSTPGIDSRRVASSSGGFTLLEVLLVVVLIALSYTLLPRMFGSGVSGTELKSNVRAVAAGLRLARETAINTRAEAILSIDTERRVFTVTSDERPHALHEKIELKLFTSQADVISETTGSFRFYPDGTSNGGRVTIAAGEREFAIDIDWLTGRVTVNDSADQTFRPRT